MRIVNFVGGRRANVLGWDRADVDISEDIYEVVKEEAKWRFDMKDGECLVRGARDLLEIRLKGVSEFLKNNGYSFRNSVRMLNAHGRSYPCSGWMYHDSGLGYDVRCSMDEWIRKHDRKYGVLFINSCNPDGEVRRATASVLVYANNLVYPNSMAEELSGKPRGIFVVSPPLVA